MLKSLSKRLKKKINEIDNVNNLFSNRNLSFVDENENSSNKKSLNKKSLNKKSLNKKSSSVIVNNSSSSRNSLFFNNIFKKQQKLHIDIDFELAKNDFIYYIEKKTRRLCISSSLKKKISFN